MSPTGLPWSDPNSDPPGDMREAIARDRREGQQSITCPRCTRTSWNPNDVREGYCGFCHWWTSDPQLGRADVIAELERQQSITPLPKESHAHPGTDH